MSWDQYVDNLIARSKDGKSQDHVDKGCIIGLDGSIWTTSGSVNLNITPAEAQTIAQTMSSADYSRFQTNGIVIEGVKYTFLRSFDKAVYGKKKDEGGITMQASAKAIIIAHCPEGRQQGLANKAVGLIVEYLEGLEF